ncbi:hypothetical protein [Actinoplanes sp. NPDC026670]
MAGAPLSCPDKVEQVGAATAGLSLPWGSGAADGLIGSVRTGEA